MPWCDHKWRPMFCYNSGYSSCSSRVQDLYFGENVHIRYIHHVLTILPLTLRAICRNVRNGEKTTLHHGRNVRLHHEQFHLHVCLPQTDNRSISIISLLCCESEGTVHINTVMPFRKWIARIIGHMI